MDEPFADAAEVPFVLSCISCDVDSPSCYDEALAAGWTDIAFTSDMPAENYLGLCPVCTAQWNAPGPSGGDVPPQPSTEEQPCRI